MEVAAAQICSLRQKLQAGVAAAQGELDELTALVQQPRLQHQQRVWPPQRARVHCQPRVDNDCARKKRELTSLTRIPRRLFMTTVMT